MELAHLFECGMLICFGFSWPLNVIKAYKAGTAKGTSLPFIILIITGYVFGITAKLLNNQINYVLIVYFLNLAIVMTNVFVYIRNKALDRKNAGLEVVKVQNQEEAMQSKYDYSQSEVIFDNADETQEQKNAVILMGSSLDSKIPVTYLKNKFEFNFEMYNKSLSNLSLKNASEYFTTAISSLQPEAMILHLGENDIGLFQKDSNAFDKAYLELIANIKKVNKKIRIALVSVNNPNADKVIADMNRHIKAVAESERSQFINIENAGLWNPEATKQSVDFAYSMGLNTRKPLLDVAKILYSFASKEIKNETAEKIG